MKINILAANEKRKEKFFGFGSLRDHRANSRLHANETKTGILLYSRQTIVQDNGVGVRETVWENTEYKASGTTSQAAVNGSSNTAAQSVGKATSERK